MKRGLTGVERVKVADGKRTAWASILLLKTCARFNIPCFWENPGSSYFWHLPELAPFFQKGSLVAFDQCAFGAKWRKHT